jgi:hypothetical protein
MAGEKASYDRDSSYNLINPFTGQEVKSVPDAELETAYYDQKAITGTEKHSDPYENDDEVYNGKEKDTTRIADKRDHLGDAVKKGHMKKLNERAITIVKGTSTGGISRGGTPTDITPVERGAGTGSAHRNAIKHTRGGGRSTEQKLKTGTSALDPHLARSRGLREAENPMVATSPATSDSPMLGLNGLNAVNTNNSNGARYNIRSILESIALQAAETFEALDENMNVPDSFASQLDQCSKALNEVYTFVTQNQQDNSQDMSTAVNPVPGKTFMTKENAINESVVTHFLNVLTDPNHPNYHPVNAEHLEAIKGHEGFGGRFRVIATQKHLQAMLHPPGEEKEKLSKAAFDFDTPKNMHNPKWDREHDEHMGESLIGKQHRLDVSGPAGKPDNKLTGHDFEELGNRSAEKAKAKMTEAAFGVFGYILRNGK